MTKNKKKSIKNIVIQTTTKSRKRIKKWETEIKHKKNIRKRMKNLSENNNKK